MSARTWTVAGLVVGAAGIVAQRVAGVAMPAVPPGLVLLAGAAVLLLATRWRWPLVVGGLAAVAEVAAVLAGAGKLTEFTEPGIAAASWVRLAGVLVAVAGAAVATAIAYRKESVTG